MSTQPQARLLSTLPRRAAIGSVLDGARTQVRAWLAAAGSVRSRILIPYVVLLALAALLPILVFSQILLTELETEVDGDLRQEMLELDQLLLDGRDPQTGERFASLEALFDVYFARNVPSAEEAFLAFVDGDLYRTSTLTRFPLDRLPSETLSDWENLGSASPGEEESSLGRIGTPIGEAYFRTARIRFEDDIGAFVVTILPADERAAIGRFLLYGGTVSLGVLVIASIAAWAIAGRVLEPVRQLTDTARSISRSDLAGRIEVSGTGEAAQMARSFNAMLDRLEAVFRSEREFVQDASHELRAPIAIIRGHIEAARDDPAQGASARLVLDELDRVSRIVDDLRVLAEAEQPGFLRLEWVDLAEFTDDLISKARALASRRWLVDAAGEARFLADRHRLTEAVMNLVNNAVQHTTEADTIAIGTALSGRNVHISVRDTGIGISSADQAVIFDRFARGAGAQRRYGGSGLGLAIVKAIAEAHAGTVHVSSRPGDGATFTIVVARDPREAAARGADPGR